MKNYLITGATKGLGLEISKAILSFEDSNIYGLSRNQSDEYLSLMKNNPGRVHFLSYDLSNSEDIRKVVFKEYIQKGIPINGFVNNAAFAYDDLITNLNMHSLKKMYDINVFTPMLLTKFVIRNMLLHKVKGSIVHISSISVHTGYKGLAMYASSKGALEAFSKNTAREWGSLGIRSNAIVAGFMETNMSSVLSEEQKNRIYKRTALKMATEKKSVAEMVHFLLTEKAKSITGQNIHVDSGTI